MGGEDGVGIGDRGKNWGRLPNPTSHTALYPGYRRIHRRTVMRHDSPRIRKKSNIERAREQEGDNYKRRRERESESERDGDGDRDRDRDGDIYIHKKEGD